MKDRIKVMVVLLGIILLSFIIIMIDINNEPYKEIFNQTSEGLIPAECRTDEDCDDLLVFSIPKACINYSCEKVECITDFDCNKFSLGVDNQDCINNTCVSYLNDCIEIARKDYHMDNPSCSYYQTCACKNYVVDEPRIEIKNENSIQIIREHGHYEDGIEFALIQ